MMNEKIMTGIKQTGWIFIILIVLGIDVVHAQTGSLRVGIQGPEAASLGKYGDVPISLYRGTVNIQIPLHNMEGRQLSIPIGLQYYGSGIKVEAIPSWVGSGWNLNATGVITRSVKGLPDERYPSGQVIGGYYNQGDQLYEDEGSNWRDPPFEFVQEIALGNIDTEPDVFYFNFGNKSGYFILGPEDEYGEGVEAIRTIPHEKLLIKPSFRTGNQLYKWTVTTQDGTIYSFENAERITEHVSGWGVNPEDDNTYYSSWFLSEIRSASGDEIIEFNYQGYAASHELRVFEEEFTFGSGCKPSDKKINTIHNISSQRLVSISSGTETIYFDASLRSDNEFRLDSLRVTSPGGDLKKQFNFNYSSRTDRLFLKSIEEIPVDSELDTPKVHSFSYEPTQLPGRLSTSIDHWGYFNGKRNGQTTVPELIFNSEKWSNLFLPGADRTSSSEHMKAGMLKKITYPTGGSTEFVYEPNDYASVSGREPKEKIVTEYSESVLAEYNKHGLQLQTKQIEISGDDPVKVHVAVNFEPKNDCGGIGDCYVYFAGHYFQNWSQPSGTQYVVVQPGTYTLSAISPEYQDAFSFIKIIWSEAEPVGTGIIGGGMRIKEMRNNNGFGNEEITKYKYRRFSENKSDKSSGVIVNEPRYHYDTSETSCEFISRSSFTRLPLGLTQNKIGYTEVTVLHDWDSVLEKPNAGKSVYFYRTAENVPESSYSSNEWPFSPKTSREWKRGQLVRVEEYNSNDVIQKRTEHSYEYKTNSPEISRHYRALSYKVLYDSQDPHRYGSDYFGIYTPYEVVSGWKYLKSVTETIFSPSNQDSIIVSEEYLFDNSSHLNLTKKIKVNSNDEKQITEYKYAHEITDDGTGVNYTPMQSRNMLTQPYSVTVADEEGRVLSKKWTLWDEFWRGGESWWRPQSEWIWTGGSSFAPVFNTKNQGD